MICGKMRVVAGDNVEVRSALRSSQFCYVVGLYEVNRRLFFFRVRVDAGKRPRYEGDDWRRGRGVEVAEMECFSFR